ncbi:unnamed protein product [Zymoseptoria tritici ST99CH_1E4]|uniref:Large ribosomal subunit protein uL29m n=1 Tax=Zymoseptoria tritici ST99CH_1E4 TaxID=1276532 RepID=A0A2H1GI86_ZYMTR|nr:unnamed protein product [Zymoseptoria tritici ST99CH_1E4]
MPPPSTMHCARRSSALTQIFTTRPTTSTLPPPFLLPAFTTPTTTSSFSTTTPSLARKDGNFARGTSALRRSGLKRQTLSVLPTDPATGRALKNRSDVLPIIPKPVLNPLDRSPVSTDPDHGLYEFFPQGGAKLLATPDELYQCGRGWTMPELRNKDWDDLWRLWWVCIKERNRCLTGDFERERCGNMYGLYESQTRVKEVKKTMRAIRAVLIERWYAWENARVEAMNDPEVNLAADLEAGEAAYLPSSDFAEDGEADATTSIKATDGAKDGKEQFTPLPDTKAAQQETRV